MYILQVWYHLVQVEVVLVEVVLVEEVPLVKVEELLDVVPAVLEQLLEMSQVVVRERSL